MIDKIRIDTVRLGTDADRADGYIKNISREISNMKNSVSQLDSMWDGPASDAFKKAFADDMNAAAAIMKNLESLHTYETNAKAEYEKCERRVSSLVSEIKV